MNDWAELKTLQDVAAAQARGDEIEISLHGNQWQLWGGWYWGNDRFFRSRPKKKTKTIVLREALFNIGAGVYKTEWTTDEREQRSVHFVRWLDTPAREIEVEE